MQQQSHPPLTTNIHQKRVQIIQCSLFKQKSYHTRLRGNRSQTKQLNIHIKTLNEKYLKKCIISNEFDEEDIQVYQKYKKMKANFQSSQYLYQSLSDRGKKSFLNYCQSSEIVRDVFRSDRMFFGNKVIILKFLSKVQSGVIKPNISWKQQYFKNKKKSIQKNPLTLNIDINANKQKGRVQKQRAQNNEEKAQNKRHEQNLMKAIRCQYNETAPNLNVNVNQTNLNLNEIKCLSFDAKNVFNTNDINNNIRNQVTFQAGQLKAKQDSNGDIQQIKQIFPGKVSDFAGNYFGVQINEVKDSSTSGFGQTKFGGGFKFSFNNNKKI